MHVHLEQGSVRRSHCTVQSLSWMGKVPDEFPDEDGWKLNRATYYQEGWLATGNAQGLVGVTFTACHCKKTCDWPVRSNYNLRGHRSEVTIVRWNEPYQKLATCDAAGVIYVWIKQEARWSVELINDRSSQVTDFNWSHDGRMALICYRDGFVLVGSVAGQRFWSSMLSLNNCHVTCGVWSHDDQQVLFGTSNGQLIVMTSTGVMVSQMPLAEGHEISCMMWSCEKFNLTEEANDTSQSKDKVEGDIIHAASVKENSYTLAVCCKNGFLYMTPNVGAVCPLRIATGLTGVQMEWSNDGKMLALGGFKRQPNLECQNEMRFYSRHGVLKFRLAIGSQLKAMTSLTWGHNDRRVFVGIGCYIYTLWVSKKVSPLQFMCHRTIQRALASETHIKRLPLPSKLRASIATLFSPTIKGVLPHPAKLSEFVCVPRAGGERLYCTMLKHGDEHCGFYTLYLEYLGGFVQLLSGMRASKLKPEFIIFEPRIRSAMEAAADNNEGSGAKITGGFHGDNVSMCSVAPSDCSPRMRRRRRRKKLQTRYSTVEAMSDAARDSDRTRGTVDAMSDAALESERARGTVEPLYSEDLPEDRPLLAVTSNIWGTKFRMQGLACYMPEDLGSLTYKTSLLHLQPRQMTISIVELSKCLKQHGLKSTSTEGQQTQPGNTECQHRRMSGTEDQQKHLSQTACQHSELSNTSGQHTYLPNEEACQQTNVCNAPRQHIDLCNSVCQHTQLSNTCRHKQLPNTCSQHTKLPDTTSCQNSQLCKPSVHHTEVCPASKCQHTQWSDTSSCQHTQLPDTCQQTHSYCTHSHVASQPTEVPNQQLLGQLKQSCVSSRCGFISAHCDTETPTLPENTPRETPVLKKNCGCVSDDKYSCCGNANLIHGPVFTQHNESVFKSGRVLDKDMEFSTSHKGPSQLGGPVLRSHLMATEWLPPQNDVEVMFTPASPHDVTNSFGTCNAHLKQAPINDDIIVYNESTHAIGDSKCHMCDALDVCPSEQSVLRSNKSCLQHNSDSPQLSPTHIHTCETRGIVHQLSHWAQRPADEIRYIDAEDGEDNSACTIRDAAQTEELTARRAMYRRQSVSSKSSDVATLSLSQLESHRAVTQVLSLPETDASKRVVLSRVAAPDECGGRDTPVHGYSVRTRGTCLEVVRDECAGSRASLHSVDSLSSDSSDTTTGCFASSPVASPSFSRKFPFIRRGSIDKKRARANSTTRVEERCAKRREVCKAPQQSASVPNSPRSDRLVNHAVAKLLNAERSWPNSPRRSRSRHAQRQPTCRDSSDDDTATQPDDAHSYEDLATFQKAQLSKKMRRARNKCERSNRDKPPCESPSHSPVHTHATKRPCLLAASQPIVLNNKTPVWNENSQVYQLDFGGRVTQESAKNFQIEHNGEQVMQFGRIDSNMYTLDFQYPFSCAQAFGIALANITQRLK